MINKYPYTDFNEYNLDWCITRIRELSDEWAKTHQEWSDVQTEWTNYKNYIDNYFAQLDLSQEVSDKINQMAEDGYFLTVFNTLFRDDVITKAGTVTSDWIADNLLQEVGYVLDKTLTVENAAADAKAVGDKVNTIASQAINQTTDFPFEVGVLTSSGDKQAGNNRIRSVHPFYTDVPMIMTLNRQPEATANVRVRALYYDAPIINHNHFLFLDDWIVTTAVGVPVSAEIKQGYWVMLLGGYGGNTPCEPLSDIVTSYDIRAYSNNFSKGELQGKTIALIGDSISTNGNTGPQKNAVEMTITNDDIGVTLSAYPTYYDVQNNLTIGNHTFTLSEVGTEVSFTPIADDVGKSIGLPDNYNANVTYTWWENTEAKLGCTFIPVCWSGASISSHENNSDAYKTSYSYHPAQIRKCGIRVPGTMTRTAPDMIVIFRGVNDFSHTPYVRIDTDFFDPFDWECPASDYDGSHYQLLAAYSILISDLRAAYPDAEIVLCTLPTFKRVNYDHFPTNNGINSLPQFNDAIRKCADFFGCKVIEFDKDGITFENCYSGGYITDSSVTPTHPNDKGHYVMSKRAVKDLIDCTTLQS